MIWADITTRWHDETDAGVPRISGGDLGALALALYGDPSPRGRTPIDMQQLRSIAAGEPSPHDFSRYMKVWREGDEKAAALWALEQVAKL